MNQLYFLLITMVFLTLPVCGQETGTLISGEIKNDSLPVENAHIINKNTQKGSISNAKGQFKITVSDKDTLIISDLQFQNKIIMINQDHLLKKFIEINLLELTNELDEVIVMQYDNMAEELGLPNAGKKPLAKIDRNLNAYSQKSTPIVILQALMFKPGGIDDIYNIVSGNRKRDRKLKQLMEEDKELAMNKIHVRTLREHFGEDFFVKTLELESELIDPYIRFCLPKGIVSLYEKQRLIEVIDIFLKNKEAFLLSLEEE